MLLARFGEDEATPGEISFANVVDLFGDIKPVEGYLEEILRRYMKTLVSMTSRLTVFDEQMRNVRAQLMGARRATLDRIVRNWRNQRVAVCYGAWQTFVTHQRELKAHAAHLDLSARTAALARSVTARECVWARVPAQGAGGRCRARTERPVRRSTTPRAGTRRTRPPK